MKRTKRYKFVKLSVFFLIYSIIHVVSVRSQKDATEKSVDAKLPPLQNEGILKEALEKMPVPKEGDEVKVTIEEKNKNGEIIKTADIQAESVDPKTKEKTKVEVITTETKPGVFSTQESTKTEGGTKKTTTKDQDLKTTVKDKPHDANKTISKDKEKCTPPAIKQFPKPLMSPEVRKHGGLIIHTIVAVYMFIGLAIVCDEYFVASLDRICEELKMSPDVAGATFMAAGSSAPELATVIIGVFCADDDIGISGVIGSAVFNIMFVISVCALASGAVVYLNWWPLIRDSTFYAIAILVMLVVIGDKEIHLWESIFMLSVYVVYGIALHFNSFLEATAHQLIPFKVPQPANEQSGLVTYNALVDDGTKKSNYGIENEYGGGYEQQQSAEQIPEWNPGSEWSPDRSQPINQGFEKQQLQQQPLSGPALNQASTSLPQPLPPIGPLQTDYYRPKEFDPLTKIDPLVRPEGATNFSWTWIKWITLYPIHFFAIYSMPDCRTDKFKNWYPFTFFMSMVWISFYSYFMVWMITIIGFTLSIPDTVMGLTFVAAGVSVPDALSSIAVIKEGYGDMAVSNAVGSNVFDILVCLGLPWFFKTAFGSPVKVVSKGLWYSTFSLLSTVVFLVVAIHYNGWKLDKKFGIVLMIWYLLFLTFASLYELNVFGNWNPPECKVPDW